jgi:hypothetical protein
MTDRFKDPAYLEAQAKASAEDEDKYQADLASGNHWWKRKTPYQLQQRQMLETVPPRSRVEEWMMEELGYIVRRCFVLKSNPGNAELTLSSEDMADTATCERVLSMCRAYFHNNPPADPIEIKKAYMEALDLLGERAWDTEQKQREKLETMPVPEQVM